MSESDAGNSQRVQRSSGQRSHASKCTTRSDEKKAITPDLPSLSTQPTECSSTAINPTLTSSDDQPPAFFSQMRPAMSDLECSDGYTQIVSSQAYGSYDGYPVHQFLSQCDLYDSDSKQWRELATLGKGKISENVKNAEDTKAENKTGSDEETDRVAEELARERLLYKPLCQIIHAIIEYFKDRLPTAPWIKETYKDSLMLDEHPIDYRTKLMADLAIMDTGGHLSSNSNAILPGYGYSHCLVPLEVETDYTMRHFKFCDSHLEMYARRCFIQQPHRRYVSALVLTQTFAYPRVYDRSGSLALDSPIHLHADAKTFVQVILGLCTVTNELESSPFDPRVRWGTTAKYPTITVGTADNRSTSSFDTAPNSVVYQVTNGPMVRQSICGRGTVCWHAEQLDPAPAEGTVIAVIIKDSWRPAERKNESQFLVDVKGLDGVGQMIDYEDDTEDCISRFRNFIVQDLYDHDYDADRIFSRIVLKAYGRSIEYFDNKLQLLYAFYDAVAGHKNLWLKSEILHRDISVENILLGNPDAKAGNRGVLIDLDVALKVDDQAINEAYFKMGTRQYQSVANLSGQLWMDFFYTVPPQDHLDDLESFFFVLSWICITYDGPWTPKDAPTLEDWESPSRYTCVSTKLSHLKLPIEHLQPYFEQDNIFVNLLIGLGSLCLQHYERKHKMAKNNQAFPILVDVHDSDASLSGKDHDDFLAVIQTAIDALEIGARPVRQTIAPPAPEEEDYGPDLDPLWVRLIQSCSQFPATSATKRKNRSSSNEDEEGNSLKRAKGSQSTL